MPRADVSDLMRHHAGELGFVICRENEPGIYVEEATRQGKGIYLVVINNLYYERNFAVRMLDQQLRLAIHIFSDFRIGQQPSALLDLQRQFSTQRNFFLDGI